MKPNLSPKDLAQIIGVSESSLKRWVDDGKLTATRTAGGHRRIPLHEAVRFIRETNQRISRPDLLGLTELSTDRITDVMDGSADAALKDALEEGNADKAKGLILAQYMSTQSVSAVIDGPISFAMNRIGEIWRHEESRGIYVEHRATEIIIETMHQIRATLPPVPDDAPVALGTSVMGDPHSLCSLFAATVLLEGGYRDVNLGADTPTDALLNAIEHYNPRIVWYAATLPDRQEHTMEQVTLIDRAIRSNGTRLAIGGWGASSLELGELSASHHIKSMTELAAFGRSMMSGGAKPKTREGVAKPIPAKQLNQSA